MKTTRNGKQWLADIGPIFVLAGLPATATGVVESKRMIEGKGESAGIRHRDLSTA